MLQPHTLRLQSNAEHFDCTQQCVSTWYSVWSRWNEASPSGLLTCRHMRASLSLSWESSALWRSISPSRCLSSSLSSRPEEGPLGSRWNKGTKHGHRTKEVRTNDRLASRARDWKLTHMTGGWGTTYYLWKSHYHHGTHTSTFLRTLTHIQIKNKKNWDQHAQSPPLHLSRRPPLADVF